MINDCHVHRITVICNANPDPLPGPAPSASAQANFSSCLRLILYSHARHLLRNHDHPVHTRNITHDWFVLPGIEAIWAVCIAKEGDMQVRKYLVLFASYPLASMGWKLLQEKLHVHVLCLCSSVCPATVLRNSEYGMNKV